MNELLYIELKNYTTLSGFHSDKIELSYQLFGQELGTAPVVLVNHALTGNSNVTGEEGWWKDLIGKGKGIDTENYTILAFNIPGNGFDGVLIENYQDFVAKDIAKLFLLGLDQLKITQLYAIIGGSLGGGLAWEMVNLKKDIAEHIIPIASDWKSTDWLIANCRIQEQFLLNSKQPVHDARMHAMLCYRTPDSFKAKFNRSLNEELEIFNVESWLLHHGNKLQNRFQLGAYKMMNHLLKTIEAAPEKKWVDQLNEIQSDIHVIGVDSDLFFTSKENRETVAKISQEERIVTYDEITSIHGHDAFLIEYDQLEKIIQPIFSSTIKKDR